MHRGCNVQSVMDRNSNLLLGEVFHQTAIASVAAWAGLRKKALKYLQGDVGIKTQSSAGKLKIIDPLEIAVYSR